ncbi:MAG: hypothetical protein IT462_04315 [Planctomycetes bacterium]|nr:hypothetical protein [Planctomycetota bacterium]
MAKLWSLALALLIGAGFWAAPAAAQSNKVEELEREVATLRSEVAGLKSIEREGQGLTSSDQAVKAQLKKSMFAWATEDGKFSFTMGFRVQVRLTYNDERGDDVEDPTAGATNGKDYTHFNIRRFKWFASGNIFEKEFKYLFTVVLNKGSANNMIEDVVFTWAKFPFLNISAGQIKVPYNHSFINSSGAMQFVDRSIVSDVFNQGWGKGVWLTGTIGETVPWVKYWFGIFNGVVASSAGDFRNSDVNIISQTFGNSVDADLFPALRVETHPLGEVAGGMVDMRSADEFDKVLFSVGLALNWLQGRFNNANIYSNGNAAPAAGSGRFRTAFDTLALCLDGHFRWHGLSVNIEWCWRHTNFHNTGNLEGNNITRGRNRPGDMDDTGIVFEVGYFILPKQLDVGLRWADVNADEFWVNGSTTKATALRPDSSELGLVVGYYLAGQNLKIQMDFTYISHQLAFFVAGGSLPTGTSLGSSPNGDALESRSLTSLANETSDWKNIWQLRIQLQWIF